MLLIEGNVSIIRMINTHTCTHRYPVSTEVNLKIEVG